MDSLLRTLHTFITEYEWYSTTYDTANNVTLSDNRQYTGNHLTYRDDNFTYGPHGNQLTHTISGITGTETTTYYDASQYFQKASVTGMLGRTTSFGVGTNTDANVGNRGSVLYVRDAGYNVTGSPSYHKEFDYTYNSYGQKLSEANMNAVVTNYTYGDQWGNLTQVVQDPGTGHLARTTSMVYDGGGRVTQSTDPMARTSQFTYNNLGQPLSAAFPAPNAETVSYSYDGNGRMHSVTDNRGTTSLAYETASDRVSSVTDPVTGAVSYTYFQGGERKSMSLPGGGTWNYAYNSQPLLSKDDPNSLSTRLYTITDDQNRIVSYSMDAQGRTFQSLTNQVFDGNGALLTYQQTDYTLDATASNPAFFLTRIKNTWWWKSGGIWTSKVLTQNDYTYNVAGMRLTNGISDVTGLVRTETYGYDELYRLTSVNYGDSHTQSYTFDPMGNRATKVNDGVSESYTYNPANMLLTRGANSYTNDLDGNTLTGGGRTNTWDSQNRLTQCVYNGNTSNFTYAADGIRHRSVLGANTTDFILDASMFVREKLNGAVSATYLAGPRGPEYRRDDQAGTVRWYVFDGHGSVLGECDLSGNLTATRSYDVYGAVRTSAGTSTSKHKYVGNLGHPSEDETGLVYMQVRYIDPAIGRFLTEDPGKSGSNWFSYGENNPTNFVDPDGKDARADIQMGILYFLMGLVMSQIFRSMISALFLQLGFGLGQFDIIEAIKGMFGVLLKWPKVQILESIGDGSLVKRYGPRGAAVEVVGFYLGYSGLLLIAMGLMDLEMERL